MTPDWVVAHARRQQRHYAWCEVAHRCLPRRWHPRAAAAIAGQFSPELPEALKIWRGLQQFSQCSDAQAHRALAQWYANQGAAAIELHDYPSLDVRWAREQVQLDNPAALADIVARGGLVLTYHSHHHNRLGAYLGLSGTTVWGIAATEENSLWKPWTGRWVRLINGGSERLFGGGRYLFTDQMRELLLASRAALKRGETVVTLADNASDSPSAIPVTLAGRTLPLATGMIDLALAAGAPISFALFYSDLAGQHRCRLASAHAVADAAGIADQYAAQLMTWLQEDAYAWQGWLWWDDLRVTATDTGSAAAAISDTTAARFDASRPRASWRARLLHAAGAAQMRLFAPRP
jgi:lauroyl/myristoyl acyltransferase